MDGERKTNEDGRTGRQSKALEIGARLKKMQG